MSMFCLSLFFVELNTLRKITKEEENLKNKEKGITLIALIVTIVVLLILAGITIGTLTGDNGIIGNSKDAKEETEIANEKEILEQATIGAMGKNKNGILEKDILQEELEKDVGDGKTNVTEEKDTITVEFTDSKRFYDIDKDGNIEQYIPYIDTTPGELATENKKDESGNEITIYKIESIEDLVTFSIMVNGGDTKLNIPSNQFTTNDTVLLMRTLDFDSTRSYNDSRTTIYNDYLGILDSDMPLIEALSNKDYSGFIPVGKLKSFYGTFDGQNYKIENIYINQTTDKAGLFGDISGIVKNVIVTGSVTSSGDYVGGIVGYCRGTIQNCANYCTVTGKKYIGGITGYSYANIEKSYNSGDITGTSHTGGIVGVINDSIGVQFCYNQGIIKANQYVGGIAGMSTIVSKITNCYNANSIIRKWYYWRDYWSKSK